MDEDRQAELASGGFDLDLVRRASQQHQPPTDYYFESIGLLLFGHTEYGARVHAAIWGALTVVPFFLLLSLVFSQSLTPILLSTFLFMFDTFLVRYSQEGRPIACGIFFATLYLYSVFGFLLSDTRNLPHFTIRLLWVFIANIGLMLSVGFQPFVFIVVAGLMIFPGFFFKRTRLKTALVYFVILVSVALSWPIISLSIDEGSKYIGEKSLQDRFFVLFEHIGSISLESWTVKIDRIFGTYLWLLGVSIILFVAGLLLKFFKTVSFNVKFFSLSLLIASIVFPAVFDLLFFSQISYGIKPRWV